MPDTVSTSLLKDEVFYNYSLCLLTSKSKIPIYKIYTGFEASRYKIYSGGLIISSLSFLFLGFKGANHL
ncbi:MAG TPA: hypothetical protein PLZ15_09175 [Melioribacteraceae bacterium]|nr:hypothetical protein [Melioribacteraceae bacterium]